MDTTKPTWWVGMGMGMPRSNPHPYPQVPIPIPMQIPSYHAWALEVAVLAPLAPFSSTVKTES